MHRCWLLVLVLLSASTVQAQEKSLDPKIERSVVFGKGGETDLKMNLAIPPGPGPFPTIVFVHGGGWKGGSYQDALMNMIMIRFAKKGYLGACIQYRLTPSGARFPAQIEDCKCAVRYLRANAEKYHIDSKRIGALGGSAGGHLVLMLGLTNKDDQLEGKGDLQPESAKQSSEVQAVVNLFGPSDLVNGNWEPAVEPLLVDFLGGAVKDKLELAKQASPLTYVDAKRTIPPILTFHGTKDNVVPYIHATKLHEALGKTKATAKLITMEGEGHGWLGEKLEKTLTESLDFFDQYLKGKQ